jgi:hypothetical protein
LGLETKEKNDKFWSVEKWKEYVQIKLDIQYYAFNPLLLLIFI